MTSEYDSHVEDVTYRINLLWHLLAKGGDAIRQ
jgi:hypothetical protein